jgi:HK97 family phage prohead protease
VSGNDIAYRSFDPELEVRSNGDGRTVVGIAVPYGRPQQITHDLREQFARGAFNAAIRAAHRIPFAREHMRLGGTLIGRLTELRDDAKGLYFEARVSPTVAGDETLALLKDGALDQVSIGFREKQNRRLVDGTVERVTADLRELAVVLEGAYGRHAAVAAVRSHDAPVCTCGAMEARSRLDEARRVLNSLPTILPL